MSSSLVVSRRPRSTPLNPSSPARRATRVLASYVTSPSNPARRSTARSLRTLASDGTRPAPGSQPVIAYATQQSESRRLANGGCLPARRGALLEVCAADARVAYAPKLGSLPVRRATL